MGGRGGLCSVEFSQEDRVDADHLQNKLLSSKYSVGTDASKEVSGVQSGDERKVTLEPELGIYLCKGFLVTWLLLKCPVN